MLPPDTKKLQKAVFLDKDGTLITDVPYNVNPALVTLEPGVLGGLAALQSLVFLLVIVSNQPGISMELFRENELKKLIASLTELFLDHGINIARFYFCPFYSENNDYSDICTCRKPAPGLLIQAAKELNIDLTNSWMIGDILYDVEAGNRAGCKTILIDNGNETEWKLNGVRNPDFTAADFLTASGYIQNTMTKNA